MSNIMNITRPDKEQIIPLPEGFTPHSLYQVEVSYSKQNPIHTAFLFVGFLNSNHENTDYRHFGGYTEIYSNTYEGIKKPKDVYYMKVARKLYQKGVDDT